MSRGNVVWLVIARCTCCGHKHSSVQAVYQSKKDAISYAQEMKDKGVLTDVYVVKRTNADRV